MFSVSMFAITAGGDSIKVRMDFNENPWGMVTCDYGLNSKGKRTYNYPSYNPEESRLATTTVFEIPACGDKVTMTVTPSDLDETNYDNAMVRDENWNNNDIIETFLYTYTGSVATFKAPKGYRMAKVAIDTYRSWASGNLYSGEATGGLHVWGPDSAQVKYSEYAGVVTELPCWSGDAEEWSLPPVTGSTKFRYIDFWFLPLEETPAVKTITLPDGNTKEVYPVASMKVSVDGETERTFSFGSYKDSDYYAVDFGDGNLVVTKEIGKETATATTTAVSGIAKGDGTITIYADDDVYYLSTATGTSTTSNIQSVDLSGLKRIQQLSLGATEFASIDLSACESLTNFTAGKGTFKSIDFSKNANIKNINLSDGQVESVNVKGCANLDYVNVTNCKVQDLDLSDCPALTGVYAQNNGMKSIKFAETFNEGIKLANVYLNNNEFTELTIPVAIGTFEAANNKIAKISLVDCTKSCKIENNCLSIATLPVKPAGLNTATKIKKFTYAPQAPVELKMESDGTMDVSAHMLSIGELEAGQSATTVFTLVDAEGNEVAAEDYEIKDGKVTFNKALSNVHFVMTTEAYPKATGANAFVSVAFDVTAPTSIKVADVTKLSDTYNLNGVKVAAPVKGINIVDGKKLLVK